MWKKIKKFVFGHSLASKEEAHEKLTVAQAIPVFGSDPLSSTAYATQEILLALAAGGVHNFHVALEIALAIAVLIIIVTISYKQGLHVFPQGGGVYNVAKKTLGYGVALVGATSLIVDYILTPAVSITAGVQEIISAVPALSDYRVTICFVMLIFLTWINRRGIKEAGHVIAPPVYFFIGTFISMVTYGLYLWSTGHLPMVDALSVTSHVVSNSALPISVMLILRAFAAGCTALTGIEAVSTSIGAFELPKAKNATKTMMVLSVILSIIFLGITFLACHMHVVPSHTETVISQIARTLFGTGVIYFAVIASVVVVLLLAANAPFVACPRLLSQLAEDKFLPSQFMYLGPRLAYDIGINTLMLSSGFLIYVFGGNVHPLIPLYSIMVFVGFSLYQLAMVTHWRNESGLNMYGMVVNGVGCTITTAVFFVVLITKFFDGAWVLIPVTCVMVYGMRKVREHYLSIETLLTPRKSEKEIEPHKTIALLVSKVNRSTLHALENAKMLNPRKIIPLHLTFNEEEGEKIRAEWRKQTGLDLRVIVSQYREFEEPIVEELKKIDAEWKDDRLYVMFAQIVTEHWYEHFLHGHNAANIHSAIERDPNLNPEIIFDSFKVGART